MKTIILILATLLTACAQTDTIVKVTSEFKSIGVKNDINFIDNRPAGEKVVVERSFLDMLTNTVPIDRISDKNLSISPINLLRNKLQRKQNPDFSTSEISIDHLEILHSYPKTVRQSQAASMASMSIAVAIVMDNSSGTLEDTIICNLQGSVDKETFNVTLIEPYELEGAYWATVFESDIFKRALAHVINQCTDEGVDKIQAIYERNNS